MIPSAKKTDTPNPTPSRPTPAAPSARAAREALADLDSRDAAAVRGGVPAATLVWGTVN